MAPKIPGLSAFTSADAKTRVFILLAALVGIGIIIYVGIRFFTNATQTTGPSQVAAAPAGLESVPGAQMTPEFYRAVTQANAQAAQQAQITGGSAVPTLINVPGQMNNQCGVICPDEATLADKINELIKAGKLAQENANKLLELAKNNVTPEEMMAALNRLISEGKISPDDARDLLNKYKKQYQDALAAESAKLMDALLKSGKLPLDAANQLLTLQKNNASPADYAEELRRLTAANKISPETAAQLLAQYQELQRKECLKQNAFNLRQMQQAGQLTADVEKNLEGLQARNITVTEYTSEVGKLLASGKITPDVASKVIDSYGKCVSAGGALNAVDALIAQEEAKCNAQLKNVAAKNKWPATVLNNVEALKQRNVSPDAFGAAITQLQQAGRLSPAEAQNVIACYKHIAELKAMAQRLMALQKGNASQTDCANELNKNVQAGIITPEQAGSLLQVCQQTPTAGAVPTVETNIPGTEGFAQLQQRLATQPAAPNPNAQANAAAAQQFAAAQAQADAAAAEARLARIQALAGAMSTQAQTLVTAWAPPTMQVVVGQAAKAVVPGGEVKETTTVVTEKGKGKGGKGGPVGPALIKAGTILYGILDTAVDSDYPDTPVMVTIVSSGPFKGARLLGKLNLADGKDKVSLAFSLMDKDGWPGTKSVSAFAIDPDTARTVMASSVDKHFLLRYGSLFAANLMAGYATAIMSSGSVQTNNANGSTVTRSVFSPREKLGVALGQVGTALSAAVAPWFNTPYTVRVNSGVGLGILFISDVPAD